MHRFGGIEALLRKHITPSDRILIVGCGNSTLSREMFDSGFIQLTNLDFSATVIERMAARHADCGPTMRWVVGDMMDMHTLDDGSFDVVLDKAAMDALLVDEGDVWNPCATVARTLTALCGWSSAVTWWSTMLHAWWCESARPVCPAAVAHTPLGHCCPHGRRRLLLQRGCAGVKPACATRTAR
eukprot:COSAG01_NODE_6228_length_3779_cov_8.384783_2_plen_184_part_00